MFTILLRETCIILAGPRSSEPSLKEAWPSHSDSEAYWKFECLGRRMSFCFVSLRTVWLSWWGQGYMSAPCNRQPALLLRSAWLKEIAMCVVFSLNILATLRNPFLRQGEPVIHNKYLLDKAVIPDGAWTHPRKQSQVGRIVWFQEIEWVDGVWQGRRDIPFKGADAEWTTKTHSSQDLLRRATESISKMSCL